MGLHVLAIGDRAPGVEPSDALMEQVASIVVTTSDVVVVRCIQPSDLSGQLAQVRGKRYVDVLDIFDHGHDGAQRLGNSFIFSINDAGALGGTAHATALRPHLSDVAQIRLLGCDTAGAATGPVVNGEKGRLFLHMLARAFGARRVVFGTLRTVDGDAFDALGFKPPLEEDYLFSSLAALDCAPPSDLERINNVRTLRPLVL